MRTRREGSNTFDGRAAAGSVPSGRSPLGASLACGTDRTALSGVQTCSPSAARSLRRYLSL